MNNMMANMQNNPWLMAMMMQAMSQGQQQNNNQGRTPQTGVPAMNPWVMMMLMNKLHPQQQTQNTQNGMGSSDPANRVASITDPNSGATVTVPTPPSTTTSDSSGTSDQTNANSQVIFQNPPAATGPFSNPTLMPGTVYNTNGRQWVYNVPGAQTGPTGPAGNMMGMAPPNFPGGAPEPGYPNNPNSGPWKRDAQAMAGPGGPPNPGQYPGPIMAQIAPYTTGTYTQPMPPGFGPQNPGGPPNPGQYPPGVQALAGNPQIPGGPPNPGQYPPTGVQAFSMFAPTAPGQVNPWLNSPEAPGGFPFMPSPFAMA